MAPPKQRPPDLDHCVQTLLRLQDLSSNQSPKLLGEIYVCGLGLLYHLKVDRKTIQKIRAKEQGQDSIPYPKPNAIPAISLVVHNQELLSALVSCLSSGGEFESSDSAMRILPMPQGSRKRTASIDNSNLPGDGFPSKIMKISHSPHVTKRPLSYARPQMNLRTLSATILFAAFEYVDHWPALFVKAYSEDCFGGRIWVDEPACRLFVENLELSHSLNIDDDDCAMGDAEKEADALIVAEFYDTGPRGKSPTNEANGSPVPRRGSLSSVASHNSSAIPVVGRSRSMSIDSADNQSDRSGNQSRSSPIIMQTQSMDNGDESDSGDEEEIALSTTAIKPDQDDGGSSSSGEEDEEVVISAKSLSGDENSLARSSPVSKISEVPPRLEPSYPIAKGRLNFERVRQRYFGTNLEHAHLAISASLSKRLDIKTKQNSGLLQALPRFSGIPEVRRLITGNLEKWLQSPALAGLARSLFAQTVSVMKNTDPPLPADLDAIDNILSMRLKANQLNAHVENINAIARRIPTSAVARHIYKHLLREVLLAMDSIDSSAGDHLKMIHAVHDVFPANLSADGIAASLMSLLFDRPPSLRQISGETFIRRICELLRAVATGLGSSFDGSQLLNSIAQFQAPNSEYVSRADEESRARLMFQCTTLQIIDPAALDTRSVNWDHPKSNGGTEGTKTILKHRLADARKVFLHWFCRNYAPFCSGPVVETKGGKKGAEFVGAGVADYASILDGASGQNFPEWIAFLRIVLFLESPGSARMNAYVFQEGLSNDKAAEWQDEMARIRLCYEVGTNVDDEMLWIVIRAATRDIKPIAPDVALPVLEHLFHGCIRETESFLSLKDPALLWELYRIVEYIPDRISQEDENRGEASENGNEKLGNEDQKDDPTNGKVPRLAYPGLWWRATGLALAMCGACPEGIGSMAWNEHPTLRVLIKMVTSDRYRFPTVDCDDTAREEMKKTEQEMRDEEARITEELFLPRKKQKRTGKEEEISDNSLGGSRASRRQREKRERLLKKQKEKEANEALKEASRRKKILRSAQKSIMLWDPRKGPRKPPKESADLIFSLGALFDLPRVFQRTTTPDFLLMTIGNTTRGAIERAYDWLIPIISFVPETITRLPASASCFLLLRAYGTEGDERAQLQELSAPLLVHVRQSLTGSFGEADSIRAFDLLLTDVASHNADRRRCARRVLHDAIGKDEDGSLPEPFAGSNCSWMVTMMNVQYSASIIGSGIRHLSRAASFERGRVLRYLIIALDKLTKHASEELLDGFHFPSVLIDLISNRPSVFASTMGSFPDLRSLAISVVHDEFVNYTDSHSEGGSNGRSVNIKNACDIVLSDRASINKTERPKKVVLPLALLESSCVILSIWLENTNSVQDGEAVENLVKLLMKTGETEGSSNISSEEIASGLASATLSVSGKSAIPVESWVMLARSRSDFIAKRAALTAPTTFLPRLLLCSGLPRASLLSMIDRLGQLGDNTKAMDKTFNQLLVPSATSEWDIGRLGRRKEVARKLLGRLSAYAKMYRISNLEGGEKISITFLEWLSDTCRTIEKSRKPKAKKDKSVLPAALTNIEECGSILSTMTEVPIEEIAKSEMLLQGDTPDMTSFLEHDGENRRREAPDLNTDAISSFVRTTFSNDHVQTLESWLEATFGSPPACDKPSQQTQIQNGVSGADVSYILLKSFSELERKTEGLGASIVKWVPWLSASSGSPEYWTVLLSDGQKPSFLWSNLISRCCQIWSHDHLCACRDWIVSQEGNESLDLSKVVRLLIQSISWGNIHVEAFVDTPLANRDRVWGFTQESVRKAITIASDCLLSSTDTVSISRSCTRNDFPEGLLLLLLLSRFGKKQVQLVSQTLVERMEGLDAEDRGVLLAAILRVYACFPQYMNLGVAVLRAALKEAVEEYPKEWLCWRSPMDDYFEDLIHSITFHGSPIRMVQALVDGSKKHPLLVLRKLGRIEELLEEDATARECIPENDNRGILFGQALHGPADAKVDGKSLSVAIRHWGFNYTEVIWTSFLDVISAVPKEVLFGCGLSMGLDRFLGAYLRLMSVQTQLRPSDRLARLKGKLSDFFSAFRGANMVGWEKWMRQEVSGLESLGSTRNVLLSCDMISHQEAIQSVKSETVNQA